MRLASVYPCLCACHAHVVGVNQRVGDIHLPYAAHCCFAIFRGIGDLVSCRSLRIIKALHYLINIAVSLSVIALQALENILAVRFLVPRKGVAILVNKIELPRGTLLCAFTLQRNGQFIGIVMLYAAIYPSLDADDGSILVIHDGIGDVHSRQSMLVKGRYAIIGHPFIIRIGNGVGNVGDILRFYHPILVRIAICIVCGQVGKRITVPVPFKAPRAWSKVAPCAIVNPALQRQRHVLSVVVCAPAIYPGLCALNRQLPLRHGVGHDLAIRAVGDGIALRHVFFHQFIGDRCAVHAGRQVADC